jgi:Arc/MetJ-type ribon-helix-helix transcriptional regulator
MSATAHDDFEPGSDQQLSALEEALRQALQSYSREQVLDRVVRVLPAANPAPDRSPAPGLHGNVQKVSVSMPSELVEAIRAETGTGGFSRYVTDAAQRRFRREQLRKLLDELEAEYGPVDKEGVQEALKEWPDYQSE